MAGIRIDELDQTVLQSRDHVVPAMKDGMTVQLSVAQILSRLLRGDLTGKLFAEDIAFDPGTGGPLVADDLQSAIEEILARLVATFPQTLTAPQQAQAAANIGAGLLSGFRNVIINPLGGINQRVKSGTVILSALAYGHDRFRAGASGCTYTFSTNNGVTTFNITAGTLQQVVESSCFAGRGGNYVLSWQGSAQARLNGGSYGDSGDVSAVADGSENVVAEWGVGTMSLPQLEREYTTEFSARHIQQEIALCQRYYWRDGVRNSAGLASSASNFFNAIRIDTPVTMRTVPTVTIYNSNDVAGYVRTRNASGVTIDGAVVPEYVLPDVGGVSIEVLAANRAFFSVYNTTFDAEF